MNVRCHTEYSAYNDLEAHNGTPHMTHEQILKFTILTYIFKGVLFLKVQYFPYVTFSEYICVQCQSKLLINIAKYCLQTCNRICDICAHITRHKMLCSWFCAYFYLQLCDCACLFFFLKEIVIQKAFVQVVQHFTREQNRKHCKSRPRC